MPEVVAGLLAVLAFLVYLLFIVGFMLVLKPFFLRSILTQDFAAAFNLRFAVRFLQLTWRECVLASLFLAVASWVLMIAGMMILCVGMYLAMGPVYYMMMHLDQQVYQLYLARGGEPVPLNPNLRDEPPPMPACATAT